MADRYTGKDVKITLLAGTANFRSIGIHIFASKWTANASDTKVVQRGSGTLDCEITIEGWDSGAVNSLEFADIAAAVLSGEAPSAFSWTDTASSPASRLPSNFFTVFPLSKMRIDDTNGGSGGPDDPAMWSAKISIGNIDAPFGFGSA